MGAGVIATAIVVDQGQKTADFVDESGSGIPGRRDAVFTQEDHANAGHGCPIGTLRTGSLTADGGPADRKARRTSGFICL